MKINKTIKDLENKEWFESIKLSFLEVIKVGLENQDNPKIKMAIKETIKNYNEFISKYKNYT